MSIRNPELYLTSYECALNFNQQFFRNTNTLATLI